MKWILLVMFINTSLHTSPSVHSTYFTTRTACESAESWTKNEYLKVGGASRLKTICVPESN